MAPFPGGKASPGHFVSGAPPAGLIQFVGAGAQIIGTNIVQAGRIVPRPIGAAVGDILFVFAGQNSNVMVPQGAGELAQWTNDFGTPGGGISCWRRVATLDANDNWTTIATAPNDPANQFMCQMAAFRIPAARTMSFTAAGPTTISALADFPIAAILVGADATDTLVLGLYDKWAGISIVPPTLTPLSTVTDISTYTATEIIGIIKWYIWTGWGYQIQSISVGIPGENPIVHAPALAFTTRAQYQRYRLDP